MEALVPKDQLSLEPTHRSKNRRSARPTTSLTARLHYAARKPCALVRPHVFPSCPSCPSCQNCKAVMPYAATRGQKGTTRSLPRPFLLGPRSRSLTHRTHGVPEQRPNSPSARITVQDEEPGHEVRVQEEPNNEKAGSGSVSDDELVGFPAPSAVDGNPEQHNRAAVEQPDQTEAPTGIESSKSQSIVDQQLEAAPQRAVRFLRHWRCWFPWADLRAEQCQPPPSPAVLVSEGERRKAVVAGDSSTGAGMLFWITRQLVAYAASVCSS